MHTIQFYIDGLNHELNLYLRSTKILDEPKPDEFFDLFTCGAEHNGYSIFIDESEAYEICNNKEFKRMINNVIEFRQVRAAKCKFVKMQLYDQAKILREKELILIDNIFSVQRKLFLSEIFCEKLDETTIGMKVFSNAEFQNKFASALLYYHQFSEQKKKIHSL